MRLASQLATPHRRSRQQDITNRSSSTEKARAEESKDRERHTGGWYVRVHWSPGLAASRSVAAARWRGGLPPDARTRDAPLSRALTAHHTPTGHRRAHGTRDTGVRGDVKGKELVDYRDRREGSGVFIELTVRGCLIIVRLTYDKTLMSKSWPTVQ